MKKKMILLSLLVGMLLCVPIAIGASAPGARLEIRTEEHLVNLHEVLRNDSARALERMGLAVYEIIGFSSCESITLHPYYHLTKSSSRDIAVILECDLDSLVYAIRALDNSGIWIGSIDGSVLRALDASGIYGCFRESLRVASRSCVNVLRQSLYELENWTAEELQVAGGICFIEQNGMTEAFMALLEDMATWTIEELLEAGWIYFFEQNGIYETFMDLRTSFNPNTGYDGRVRIPLTELTPRPSPNDTWFGNQYFPAIEFNYSIHYFSPTPVQHQEMLTGVRLRNDGIRFWRHNFNSSDPSPLRRMIRTPATMEYFGSGLFLQSWQWAPHLLFIHGEYTWYRWSLILL